MSTLKAGNIQPQSDSDPLILSTNATERIRIDTSGNIGVGTDSPQGTLHVVASVNNFGNTGGGIVVQNSQRATIRLQDTTTNFSAYIGAADNGSTSNLLICTDSDAGSGGTAVDKGSIIFASKAGTSELVRIASDGKVGIGNNTPNAYLTIGDGSYSAINEYAANFTSDSNDPGYGGVLFSQNSTNAFKVWPTGTGNTEPSGIRLNLDLIVISSGLTLDSRSENILTVRGNGWVGLGLNTPQYQLHLSTDSAAKPTSSAWTIASDARLKTVVGDWDKGLEAVCSLRPVKYRLNGQYGTVDDGKEHVSVLAQEAMQVMPEMIGTYEWRETAESSPVTLYNLDTNSLQWSLVQAIKELRAIVQEQAERIAALEAT